MGLSLSLLPTIFRIYVNGTVMYSLIFSKYASFRVATFFPKHLSSIPFTRNRSFLIHGKGEIIST